MGKWGSGEVSRAYSSPLEGEPNPSWDLVGGVRSNMLYTSSISLSIPPTKIVKNDFGSPA